ncbi:hypothetical protein BK645_09855 [Pseudomonas protegens]|uniref:FkbM family methyltransferase n=1 Tax=Pseudomonas protegens TaxID=380021 RepID=UPI000363E5F6|nr:FkbM family methyltransferase [Pseudomonas protegens]ROM29264.1 hypothetical protein BK645_09855 [Pseudomonas protegens]ROM36896.1 hypothetical protein BK646_17895 [Pseudomonas protegens]
MSKKITIAGKAFKIEGEDAYARSINGTFEPELTELIQRLCDEGDNALDVGGNIGMTALAISTVCGSGKVAAVEPVPAAYFLLEKNTSQVSNVKIWNFALGKTPGTLPMQGYSDNLSGSFISDAFHVEEKNHFTVNVEVKTIDDTFSTLGLDRLDFMKIDVEGFELEVLEGAAKTLQQYKPRVILEMNHWCLNMFRRISIPEFRERLMAIFPVVYAVEAGEYLDFTDPEEARIASHAHLINMKFTNIVAGYDREDILRRLKNLDAAKPVAVVTQARMEAAIPESLLEENTRLQADNLILSSELQKERSHNADILNSTSWKITAPIRKLKSIIG